MRSHSTGKSGSHSLEDRGLDLYETPAFAVIPLLRAENLPHGVWEPVAGPGAIVRVLRDHRHRVVASDVFDYGGLDFVADFLTVMQVPAGCECVLTNPPFQIINKFIAHALDLSPLVVILILARLALLDSGERTEILEHRNLARIHVFRERLPGMHRAGWTGNKVSPSIAFAWFVWDRNHRGLPTVDRISRAPKKTAGRIITISSYRSLSRLRDSDLPREVFKTEIHPSAQAAKKHPTYIVRLRAKPGVNAIRALRSSLKTIGRRYDLQALSVHEERTP